MKDKTCKSQACFDPSRALPQGQGHPMLSDQTYYLVHMADSDIGESHNS